MNSESGEVLQTRDISLLNFFDFHDLSPESNYALKVRSNKEEHLEITTPTIVKVTFDSLSVEKYGKLITGLGLLS